MRIPILLAALSVGLSTATAAPAMAQSTLAAKSAAPPSKGGMLMPSHLWFNHIEGRRVAPWGRGVDYAWTLNDNGDGVLSLPAGGDAAAGTTRDWPFRLSAAQLDRFAALIRQFERARYDEARCATDQAQETVRWTANGGPGGMARFDYGCTDPAARAKWTPLNDAVLLLRQAAGAPAA